MAIRTSQYRVTSIRYNPGTRKKVLVLERVNKPINPKKS